MSAELPAERVSGVKTVLDGIAEGVRLADEAERAYRAGDNRAALVHAEAECAHGNLLRSICDLEEDEADSVEPAFTDFETRLLKLPNATVISLWS